jgi:DNA excision repair protein ERCC-4
MSAPLDFPIIEDTRNQVPLPWHSSVIVERRTMPEADVTTPVLWGIGAIEIKRKDFAPAVGSERERFDREIERLQSYRFKCIVVADDITHVYRETQVHPHAILGSIASWYARWDVPTIFAGNDHGAARLIIGILKRWQQRVEAERGVAA